jgi:hypothetical protein
MPGIIRATVLEKKEHRQGESTHRCRLSALVTV